MGKKIGNDFQFTAQIRGKNEVPLGDNPGIKVKLKEKDGKEYDWSSFHPSEFNDYNLNDFIKIEAHFSENDKGKWPFRNVSKVLGRGQESEWSYAPRPKEDGSFYMPQQSSAFTNGHQPPQSPTGTGSRPFKSDEQVQAERESIERQSSINAAARLCEVIMSNEEQGKPLSEVLSTAQDNLPAFLDLASNVYDYYRQKASAKVKGQKAQPTTKPEQSAKQDVTSQVFGDFEPDKMEHIGHLLTAALNRWGKSKEKVCDYFGVDSENPSEILKSHSLSEAWEAMKANWDGPDPKK